MSRHRRGAAFSLIELVMVVAIIAVVGAIAVPRFSRGSRSATAATLAADLRVLNSAVEAYMAEHGGSPPTAALIADQLTQFTDENGNASTTKANPHVFGPYVRAIPPIPIGVRKGATGIGTAPGAGIGWIYDVATATITANTGIAQLDGKVQIEPAQTVDISEGAAALQAD